MIKDALSSLPARPALVIAPLLVVLVLSFYYRDLHAKCTAIRAQRQALNEFLAALPPAAQFRLADFTGFAWDKVRVVASLESVGRELNCPLGWNWSNGERESLLQSGKLSVLIFGHQERVVDHLELSSEQVAFRGVASILTPDTAVFSVGRPAESGGGLLLTLRP